MKITIDIMRAYSERERNDTGITLSLSIYHDVIFHIKNDKNVDMLEEISLYQREDAVQFPLAKKCI